MKLGTFKKRELELKIFSILLVSCFLFLCSSVSAIPPNQSSGSLGVQGIIPSPPPSRGATIAVPANGTTFTNIPVTVSGICPSGLLIKVFDNNAFVGSTICTPGGSYSLLVDLFSGKNDLVARDYDALDQAGPDSNLVSVNFNNAQFIQFGTQVTLSSVYAERGAAPGSELDWPIILSGGNGPYALSVDWGDGSPFDLISQSLTGTLTVRHTYKSAGVYNVLIKVTDKNGEQAFLQLVGQATGAIQHLDKSNGSNSIIEKKVVWWPALAMLPLILVSFWIGRRYELYTLRKRLQR